MNHLTRFVRALVLSGTPALFLPLLLHGQAKTIQTDQLIRESDVIVVGKVDALKSEWTEDSSRIQTLVTFSVAEAIKGDLPGGSLSVVVPGGEVADIGEWYSHSVRFKEKEEVVLFAKKDSKGIMRVTAGEHGKFLITDGVKAGSKIIPNIGSLEDFTGQVKNTVRIQKSSRGEN